MRNIATRNFENDLILEANYEPPIANGGSYILTVGAAVPLSLHSHHSLQRRLHSLTSGLSASGWLDPRVDKLRYGLVFQRGQGDLLKFSCTNKTEWHIA